MKNVFGECHSNGLNVLRNSSLTAKAVAWNENEMYARPKIEATA